MTIASVAATVSRKLVQGSPAILTGLGVAGVIATAVLTGKAAVQASRVIEEAEIAKTTEDDDQIAELTAKEKVQLTWKYFVPPLLAGSATIACVISAQSINSRRNAALMSMYAIVERAGSEFMAKTEELHGANKVEKIKEEIIRDRMEKNPPPAETLYDDALADHLAYDAWTDRYFRASRNDIDRAVNEVNHEINTNMFCSLNTFYQKVGLGALAMGEDFGWNVDHPLAVSFQYIPAEDGRPCMAVTFKSPPQQDYYSFR